METYNSLAGCLNKIPMKSPKRRARWNSCSPHFVITYNVSTRPWSSSVQAALHCPIAEAGRTPPVTHSHCKIITLYFSWETAILLGRRRSQTIHQRWFQIIIIIVIWTFFRRETLSTKSPCRLFPNSLGVVWTEARAGRRGQSGEISSRAPSGQRSSTTIIKSWSTLCRQVENCRRKTFVLCVLYLELVTPHVETNTHDEEDRRIGYECLEQCQEGL